MFKSSIHYKDQSNIKVYKKCITTSKDDTNQKCFFNGTTTTVGAASQC